MNERVDSRVVRPECGQQRNFRYNLCSICYYASLQHEGIVVGAVLRYFSSAKFETFSTEREHEIEIGSSPCRADVVFRDEVGQLAAIAECKKIGFAGERGMAQLEDYRTILYYQGNSRFWNPNALVLGGKTALLERTKPQKYI